MQIIDHRHLKENLTTVIDEINEKHQPVCLQLSDSVRAIVLSEEDYNSMVETLYLLSNPVNAEKLLQAVDRTPDSATPWQQVKNELMG
ncbi:type II toxin-antitoxin system Phd/YefM family antitoxin [Geminocystis sp. CENA526]|uniref:type II toxin-antitoxin system Phd/YefM family antitoxin n=1 Tax=Geminocystis sp. CENA526 TaxID=1355871 RepID=UPI003D6F56BB